MTPTKTITKDPSGEERIIIAGQGHRNDSFTKDEIKARMEKNKPYELEVEKNLKKGESTAK